MAETKTDRDIVKLIGMSEASIGTLIGKSRQAIAQGLVKEETKKEPEKKGIYFRDHELSAIFLHLKKLDAAKAKILEDHIRLTRPNSAADILTSNGIFLDRAALLNAPFLLAVIPDYRFFSTMHPDAFANLALRMGTGGVTGIVVGDDTDRDLVESDISNISGSHKHLRVLQETHAQAFPYCLFSGTGQGDKVQCWILGTGGYQQIDPVRADGMFRFLFDGGESQVIANMKAIVLETARPTRRRK